MKMDSKKILTIGAGAVVGYLLFCKFMKRGAEKSLQGGEEAPTEEQDMGGGGGGGGFSPMPILPVTTPPAVIVNNTSYTPQSGVPTYNASQYTSTPQTPSGAPAPTTTASTTISRDTPTPTPIPDTSTSSTTSTKPPVSAISKFTDFDGNPNFQDQLL